MCSIASTLGIVWCGQIDPVPVFLAQCPYWQYGTGKQYSEARSILKSVVLSAFRPDGYQMIIRHLVFYVLSQLDIRRNGMSRADIVQVY